jgi:hypothetical protein
VKPIGEMSAGELAAYVADRLARHRFRVVLSGGGCVMLYTRNRYESSDLDFIREGIARVYEFRPVLEELGFFMVGTRMFRHPEAAFFLDFPGGPPAVGNEPVREFREMRLPTGTLRLLSPTDCVKDRLAWYYHNRDRPALEQALLVAEATEVDLDEVERWSCAEGMGDAFAEIKPDFLRAADGRAPPG